MLPLRSSEKVEAILILGLNPRLLFTDRYQAFIQTIRSILSSQIVRLRSAEEDQLRDSTAESPFPSGEVGELKFARFAERSTLGLALFDTYGKVCDILA